MSDRKWFLFLDGQVTGPFTENEAETQALTKNSYLLWGRGLNDWYSLEKWKKKSKDLETNIAQSKLKADRLWKVRIDGNEASPMNYGKMLDFLKSKADLATVQVWTEGYTEWKAVFQIHRIIDELGVSRRKYPRVPIDGQIFCESTDGNFTIRALSISEGGLGATEALNMKIGNRYKMTLKSPNLFNPIHATAEVVYIENDDYVGLKFIGIHSESKSVIIEYIKKFTDSKPIK